MSNVVQFLESLARHTRPLSAEGFATAVADAGLEPAERQAVMACDPNAINQLLGGRMAMMCLIAPAENDEPQQEQEDEQEGEESPNQEAESSVN